MGESFHLFSILEYFSIPTVEALQALEHACKNAGNNERLAACDLKDTTDLDAPIIAETFNGKWRMLLLLHFMRFHDFLLFRAYVERNHLEAGDFTHKLKSDQLHEFMLSWCFF